MRRDLITVVLGAAIAALALGNLLIEVRIQRVEHELSDAREQASQMVPMPATRRASTTNS